MAPTKIKGRRLPQRVRALSEIHPITGSAMPSHNRRAINIIATWVGDICNSILNTGYAIETKTQIASISTGPPKP